MYRVIEGFYDLQDPEGRSYHLYDKGDTYPREGLNPSGERIAELSGNGNARRTPLIEEIPAEDPPVEEAGPVAETETAPVEAEAPKKRRSRKAE